VTRVLFFSPYGQWHYHVVQELTLAHALALRGAEVRVVSCNGLFSACDVYREGLNPRDGMSCLRCQAMTVTAHADLGVPFEWLGAFIPRASHAAVLAWAEALRDDELLRATWKGWPVGEWATSSAFFQFRMSSLELSDPKVVAGLRQHVHGAALAVEGLEPLLDEVRPDLLVTLNGRFFSHRAAFELARARGIRVVTHERGLLRGSMRFADNRRIHDIAAFHEMWERWRDVPLSRRELAWTAEVLEDRRHGRRLPWVRYSPPPQDEGEVRARLGVGDRPVLALFTSSDDESAAFPDRRRGAFPDSLDWLPASVELARALPSHVLVIRLHPNLVGAGVNRQALDRVEALRRGLPENVRLVMPADDVSSYTLADMADVGLVYFSTLGLEMAARGQEVVATALGWYGHAGFVRRVDDRAAYVAAVSDACGRGRSEDVARAALRFACHCYRDFAVPFPLVVEEPRHHGQPLYASLDELALGREPNLDRICAFLLDGAPLHDVPTAWHERRTSAAEDAFLPEWLAGVPGASRAGASA
jgi:hypothetical protein